MTDFLQHFIQVRALAQSIYNIQMNQTTNPLQKIIEMTHLENHQSSDYNQQNPFALDNLCQANENVQKAIQKHKFFDESPNLLLKLSKVNSGHKFGTKNGQNQQNEHIINRRLNFQEDSSTLKWFGFQNQSNNLMISQFQFSPKKRTFAQFQAQTHPINQIQFEFTKQQDYRQTKNERGLKNLSQNVLSIMKRSQTPTTFNQVAQLLLRELRERSHMDTRDQKNVKRRAYDALNVMISSDIIQKKDKFINLKTAQYQELALQVNTKKINNPYVLHKFLKNKIFQKTKLIQLKRKQKISLTQKQQIFTQFFNSKIQSQIHQTNGDKIYFPFVALLADQQNHQTIQRSNHIHSEDVWQKQNSSTCDQIHQEHCVFINFKKGEITKDIQIFGDIDLVTLHHKNILTSINKKGTVQSFNGENHLVLNSTQDNIKLNEQVESINLNK